MFGIVISHYGVTYIFLFLFTLPLLIQYLPKVLSQKFFGVFNTHIEKRIFFSLWIAYTIIVINWYLYTSQGRPFETIVRLLDNIYESIFNDLLNPYSRDLTSLVSREEFSIIRAIVKWSNGGMIVTIIIGFLTVLFGRKKFNFDRNFFIFSLGSVAILGGSVVLPSFSDNLSFERLYQILLIFLSPFGIIGLMMIIRPKNIQNFELVLSIILSIFLLFNAGVISEIVHDKFPISIALNRSVPSTSLPYYTQNDVVSAKWLDKYGEEGEYFGSRSEGEYIIGSLVTKGILNTFTASTNDTCYSERDSDIYILITTKEKINDQIIETQNESKNEDKKFLYKSVKFTDSIFRKELIMANEIYDSKDSGIYFCEKRY
jgi:uncharacterized membrane protein